jgi:tetratricopeptide (TPR) repeat protein
MPSAPAPGDRERWNDFGIGLLLQRDYKGAAAAFQMVTQLEPGYADGWVNAARVAVEEGDHARAIELLGKALAIDPKLPKAHYFRALALRTYGRYDEAAADLQVVTAAFPRDRVVWNALGRVRFLQRRYQEAVDAFKQTLSIDPEDVSAHYNLMLCYRGLHDESSSKLHEDFYTRFKADESAQAPESRRQPRTPADPRAPFELDPREPRSRQRRALRPGADAGTAERERGRHTPAASQG